MLKERFRQFMFGRYGNDLMNRRLTAASLVIMLLGLLFRHDLLYWLGFLLLGWAYFRMFSRNLEKRRHENELYYQLEWQLKEKFSQARSRFAQRKDYAFFRCPQCGQQLRVPRGRGRIEITCPKCHNQFVKKS